MKISQKAQSLTEYLVVGALVMGVIVVFATGVFQGQVTNVFDKATEGAKIIADNAASN